MARPRIRIETFPILDDDHAVRMAMIVNGTYWSPAELAAHSKERKICWCRKCITCRVRIAARVKAPEAIDFGERHIMDLSPRLPTYLLNENHYL